MPEKPESLEEAVAQIVDFRDKRDWAQYHTPDQLSRALSIEASELEEEFLWKDPKEARSYVNTSEGRKAAEEEIGDVLIYALLFCERVGINPLEAIGAKLEKNREKFPVEDVKGQATFDDSHG